APVACSRCTLHFCPVSLSPRSPTTETYPLSLHDALPICSARRSPKAARRKCATIRASSRPTWARERPMAEALLELSGVSAAYGNIQALHEVSLRVPQGAIVALLGAHGAGKSTTLNVVSRLVNASTGTVRFAGEPIQRLPADAVVRRGIVQGPGGRAIFREMSVREDLEMGAYLRADRAAARADMERIFDTFARLRERRDQKAAT